jgi:beta-glucosidase
MKPEFPAFATLPAKPGAAGKRAQRPAPKTGSIALIGPLANRQKDVIGS